MAEYVAKCRHGALEDCIAAGFFVQCSTLANNPVQEAIRMVPSVPVAIERRWWQCAVDLLDMPVGLTLATGSVAGSTIRSENLLPCWWRLGSRSGADVGVSSPGEDEQLTKKREPSMTRARAVA